MRVFIGFKYQDGDGRLQQVPVLYGDMNRQVANIIRENTENKLLNVPRIACYVTGFELDRSRLSDSSFVSKVNIRERRYDIDPETGNRNYQPVQGGNYTVERLMPTPYKLSMKTDIWTSNTEQKLQLLEQISVLFNPSLEIQSTDNYLDWTSLSVVELDSIQFSSRSIPQGVDSDIEITSMAFEMPIWISPPAKVKKLGIIQSIIANVFTDEGNVVAIDELAFNQDAVTWQQVVDKTNVDVLLLKSELDPTIYEVTIVDQTDVVVDDKIGQRPKVLGSTVDWNRILEPIGSTIQTNRIFFKQPSGYELVGTFSIDPITPEILRVSFDPDTVPTNSKIDSQGRVWGFLETGEIYQDAEYNESSSSGTVDAIVDPRTYNPLTTYERSDNIPEDFRLLILDDIGQTNNSDGAKAWKSVNGVDFVAPANSIIRWDGTQWVVVFDPSKHYPIDIIIQNLKTLIKYRWDGTQWLRAFEGHYLQGQWGLLPTV